MTTSDDMPALGQIEVASTAMRELVLDLPGGPLALQISEPGTESASDLTAELRRLWSHVLLDPAPDGDIETLEIAAPSALPVGTENAEAARARLERATYDASGRITRAVLPRLVGSRVLLHAGTVQRKDGGVTTVIGPSGAGKSTAISMLGRGEVYLSDELSIIDPDTFAITGYPKPVSRVATAGHKCDVALSELGLTPACTAGPPDQILLLNRDPARTAPAELTRCPMATAIVRIIEQSSSMWLVPRPLETLARLLDSVGGALEAHYCEASDLPELLRDIPAARHQDWTVIDGTGPETSESPASIEGPELQQCAMTTGSAAAPCEVDGGHELPALTDTVTVALFHQALLVQDGAVILREMRVVHLTGLNALVWELLVESGPMAGHDVASALIAAIGPHPQAQEFTLQALHQLGADALIRSC